MHQINAMFFFLTKILLTNKQIEQLMHQFCLWDLCPVRTIHLLFFFYLETSPLWHHKGHPSKNTRHLSFVAALFFFFFYCPLLNVLKLPFQQEAKSRASALEAVNTGLNMLLLKQGSSTVVQDEKQRQGSIFQCFHLEVETPSLAFSSLRRNGVVPPDTAARHSALLGGGEVPPAPPSIFHAGHGQATVAYALSPPPVIFPLRSRTRLPRAPWRAEAYDYTRAPRSWRRRQEP